VEFQYGGACGVVHTSLWTCIPMDRVIVSADIAEVRYLMILVGSLALTSPGILQGQLRHTVKTGVIITFTREILKLSRGQDKICQRTLSTPW
jgi:hypothetical protein